MLLTSYFGTSESDLLAAGEQVMFMENLHQNTCKVTYFYNMVKNM